MDGVEKVPSSPTHSVSDLHRTIKTNTHSSEQETLKNNKACGNNELDVSDNKRQHHKQVSRITQLNNNKALSYELQRSSTRKEELCITSDHEGQGISYSQQHTHLEHIPFKKRAKMAAQFPTTEGATKKSKRRAIDLESGDSPHSPSLPKHHQPLQPVDHREYELQSYYASRSSEIQMNDVLQRLQKLEEFQHAHAMGAIKVKGYGNSWLYGCVVIVTFTLLTNLKQHYIILHTIELLGVCELSVSNYQFCSYTFWLCMHRQ